MFASLPWYDLPEVRPYTDAWWRVLRRHLVAARLEVEERLERFSSYNEQWRSDALLLSQACGYDVRLSFAHRLQLVATPCYGAVGCNGPYYSSYVVVAANAPWEQLEDLRGGRCLVNTATSHSGMNILRAMVSRLCEDGRFFGRVALSGSHRRSVRAITAGDADIAAIDCVTWALLERHAPAELAGVRILCRTAEHPAPPYVTGASVTAEQLLILRTALRSAIRDPEAREACAALLLDRFEELPLEAYDALADLHHFAEVQGYFELHPGLE